MLDGLTAYRPVVLFSTDNVYLKARGMYYQYPEAYSSYYCKTERELVDMIRSAVWTKTDDERRAFFASACDGNSTRRVIDLIKRVNV
jgi:CDP-glycerol glycerophosphotransferase (TagB/SpsB family)